MVILGPFRIFSVFFLFSGANPGWGSFAFFGECFRISWIQGFWGSVPALQHHNSMDRCRCRPELQRELGAIGPYEFQGKFIWTQSLGALLSGKAEMTPE